MLVLSRRRTFCKKSGGKKAAIVIGENSEKEHAEINALRKYRRHPLYHPREKVVMVVLRLNSLGEFRESKPCFHCTCSLKKISSNINISHIFYCDKYANIVKEKILTLQNHKISSGRRNRNM